MNTKRRNILNHLKLFILFLLLSFCTAGVRFPFLQSETVITAEAASVPGLQAKITEKNILKLLKKYDSDGAYIMNTQIKNGADILSWFQEGSTIFSSIDTAVHEETHGYSYLMEKDGKAAYFIGNKKTIYVPYTTVYRSREMAATIPSRLQTFRYSTYVGDPDPNMASDVDGIYGLLNEFMAYRAGMNTTLELYDYLTDQNADWDMWAIFINQSENDMQAYAEFKYYILHYLYYAKKNYPDIYKGIINNRQFCKAYKKLESSYAKLIRQYQKDLKKLQTWYANKGYTLTIRNSTISLTNTSHRTITISRFYTTYQKLQKELSKSRYTKLHQKLLAGAG